MGKKRKADETKKADVDWLKWITILFLFGSFLLPFLVLNENTIDPAYLVRYLILQISIVVTTSLLLFLPAEKRQVAGAIFNERTNPIFILFLVYIVVKVISMFVATNTSEAFFDILASLTCILFFMLLNALIKVREQNRQLMLLAVLALNITALLFCLFAFAGVGFNWVKMGEVGSQMVNPNLLAPLFFLFMPFLLILSKRTKFKAWINLLLIADVFLIISLQNRATYLALALGVVAYIGAYVFTQKKVVFKATYGALIGIGIAGAVFLSNNYKGYWQILTDRTVEIHDNYNSTTERLQIWNRSILLFKDNPILGIGTGNWPLRVGEYGITDPYSDRGSKYFLRPHNELLRVLSETGLVGFAAIAVMVLLVVRLLLKMLKNEEKHQEGLALTFGLAGFVAIAALSFPTERIPLMTLTLAMLSFLDIRKSNGAEMQPNYLLAFIFIAAAIAINFYERIENDTIAKKMDDARNAKRWDTVMKYHHEINRNRYNVNYFRVPIDFYSGLAFYHNKKIEEAKKEFSSALLANPNHILTLTNLATCFQQTNKADSAEFYFKRALQVNPNFQMAKLNLAITYFSSGAKMKAWETLLTCENPPNNIRAAISRGYLVTLLENSEDEELKRKITTVYNQERWLLWVYNETRRGLSLEEILEEI